MVEEEREFQFYYFGLYAALRRYRFMTMLGWVVVLVGLAALPLAWNHRSVHPMTDAGLAACLVVAGLAIVQQSVASLEAYLRVPFQSAEHDPERTSPALLEILRLMDDIRAGGWHEAYRAIGRLRAMEQDYGLPPLTRAGPHAYL